MEQQLFKQFNSESFLSTNDNENNISIKTVISDIINSLKQTNDAITVQLNLNHNGPNSLKYILEISDVKVFLITLSDKIISAYINCPNPRLKNLGNTNVWDIQDTKFSTNKLINIIKQILIDQEPKLFEQRLHSIETPTLLLPQDKKKLIDLLNKYIGVSNYVMIECFPNNYIFNIPTQMFKLLEFINSGEDFCFTLRSKHLRIIFKHKNLNILFKWLEYFLQNKDKFDLNLETTQGQEVRITNLQVCDKSKCYFLLNWHNHDSLIQIGCQKNIITIVGKNTTILFDNISEHYLFRMIDENGKNRQITQEYYDIISSEEYFENIISQFANFFQNPKYCDFSIKIDLFNDTGLLLNFNHKKLKIDYDLSLVFIPGLNLNSVNCNLSFKIIGNNFTNQYSNILTTDDELMSTIRQLLIGAEISIKYC